MKTIQNITIHAFIKQVSHAVKLYGEVEVRLHVNFTPGRFSRVKEPPVSIERQLEEGGAQPVWTWWRRDK
jgi:hypothetical protein